MATVEQLGVWINSMLGVEELLLDEWDRRREEFEGDDEDDETDGTSPAYVLSLVDQLREARVYLMAREALLIVERGKGNTHA